MRKQSSTFVLFRYERGGIGPVVSATECISWVNYDTEVPRTPRHYAYH